MSRVLIVEDEQHLADGLRFNLEAEGYQVDVVGDGEVALALLTKEHSAEGYDAVVLDVMLPGIDGFAVASELRQAGQFVPVLMLTARSRPEDVLRGFEAGADDYLPKPFELAILVARLHGLIRRHQWLRRSYSRVNSALQEAAPAREHANLRIGNSSDLSAGSASEVFAFAGKSIDFVRLELQASGRVVQLTLMEADLLRYLVQHENQPISRKRMLTDVWGVHQDTDTRAIDNFIVRLRRYIEAEPAQPKHLLTVRGVGYRFVAEPANTA